jgi:DNA-binding MarR family transcriptional regulator
VIYGKLKHQAPCAQFKNSAESRMIRDQALFRYSLRKLLRKVAVGDRSSSATPRQQELLLGVAGFAGSGMATISDLAEFLQEKHNSVVGLVDRAELSGLVRRESHPSDRRVVRVALTPRGRAVLTGFALHHREQVNELSAVFGKFRKAGMTFQVEESRQGRGQG